MTIERPSEGKITIYSKSGCTYCVKSKDLLEEKYIEYSVINCDEYLLEDRDAFISEMKDLIGSNCA